MYKFPLYCKDCRKELTILEASFDKDKLRFDFICVNCGTEGFYVVSFQMLILTAIKLEKKEGDDGGKIPEKEVA